MGALYGEVGVEGEATNGQVGCEENPGIVNWLGLGVSWYLLGTHLPGHEYLSRYPYG